jgi:hypothetical protein
MLPVEYINEEESPASARWLHFAHQRDSGLCGKEAGCSHSRSGGNWNALAFGDVICKAIASCWPEYDFRPCNENKEDKNDKVQGSSSQHPEFEVLLMQRLWPCLFCITELQSSTPSGVIMNISLLLSQRERRHKVVATDVEDLFAFVLCSAFQPAEKYGPRDRHV